MPGLEDLYREIILDHYRAPLGVARQQLGIGIRPRLAGQTDPAEIKR